MKSIVLLSGGLDSATVLALVTKMGDEVHALSFRYGQRHGVELDCATELAKQYRVKNHVLFDIPTIAGSALTNSEIAVPKHEHVSEISSEIPPTYVPARNTIFLSFAVAYAESIGSKRIFIGVNSLDYSGYPDCRPEYISAFETMANLGTKCGGIKIHTPLIYLTKAEIISIGLSLGVDYSKTSSCYDPVGREPCGKCDSCLLRKKGFDEQ